MNRLCEYCGKPLTGKREQFCSDACTIAAHQSERRMANKIMGRERKPQNDLKEKVCVDCGYHFFGYPRSIRCEACRRSARNRAGKECKERRQNGKGRALGSTDFCEKCGKPYIVNGGRQRFCSECAIKNRNEIALEKYYERYNTEECREKRNELRRITIENAQKLRIRKCPTCGKSFTPTKEHRSYCSDECASGKTLVRNNAPAQNPHGLAGKPGKNFVCTENGEKRVAAGLTKDRLGELAGVKPRTIYDWEHGRPVSEKTRNAIENVINEYMKKTVE